MTPQNIGTLAGHAKQASDEGIALDPQEAFWCERDPLAIGGPDSGEPGVVVLKVKYGPMVEYPNDVHYEMADGEGGSIPSHVTQWWEGSLLPLASPPDVGIPVGEMPTGLSQ